MKKYVKPELFFESFELSQQIAACDFDFEGNFDAQSGTCQFTGSFGYGETVVIFLDNCGRNGDGSLDARDYAVCYHNSSDGVFGIFNS